MEWHRLIDHCALVGCLLADEQSVYDPRIPSDRLMLGVQGAMSELEASNIRRRMMADATLGHTQIRTHRCHQGDTARPRDTLMAAAWNLPESRGVRPAGQLGSSPIGGWDSRQSVPRREDGLSHRSGTRKAA